DIATVERRAKTGKTTITYQGKPAVELKLFRSETGDSLKSAKILHNWLEKTRPKLPPNIQLQVYNERWEAINERISLLLRNGLGGLVLVVAILFLFLNGRVAFWVAAGIPISLMGMLAVLYLAGGSINMVSLFAMIMALGVIVDDAIVVGEDGFTHFQIGEKSLLAAEGGAQRMLAPVTAASLTTISAFIPLMMIGGTMGNILIDIPIVMICVLVASLIECFFILPGHLRHTFHNLKYEKPTKIRQKLDSGFNILRDKYFRPFVTIIIDFRW
ncbi:MAG: efflux RND transporter permease subunit, partial [Proteobacteria bacterium]|nr:efflux RND transporter permease subunit [Pseudomonadota bacterium]